MGIKDYYQTLNVSRILMLKISEKPSTIRCPLHFTDPKMCLAHTTVKKTRVEELNPALSYRIGKSIPAGDTCCEHIIEIRSAKGSSE
jgi:hypothetical protein